MSSFSSKQEIREAADALISGAVVAFPTETVYGLGAIVWDVKAVRTIFSIKGRPATNPLIVHLHDQSLISQVARITNRTMEKRLAALAEYWPGPLSVILPKTDAVPSEVSAGHDTVAIRIPNHPVALGLLEACGQPVAAPSANTSNYISPTTAAHVRNQFGENVPYVLDGGNCVYGIESTVISLVDDDPCLLRPGTLTHEELETILGTRVILGYHQDNKGLTPSPGMQAKHYSPSTPLAIYRCGTDSTLPSGRTGLICFHRAIAHSYGPMAEVRVLSETGKLSEVSFGLYAVLAELDQLGLDQIVLDTRIDTEKDCPSSGLGAALLDRIQRAGKMPN
ncbi:MAG: threonylcarbamoyl-AMP synthase [Bdellovibrionales bacterium]|nr:threonylcarbamoyl-AMP synthase [Bdellovibrionales bacterium]